MQNKRIVLIVGGGIAAFKSLELVRRLKERGASVRAIVTKCGAVVADKLGVAYDQTTVLGQYERIDFKKLQILLPRNF